VNNEKFHNLLSSPGNLRINKWRTRQAGYIAHMVAIKSTYQLRLESFNGRDH
jgi:hypothetical protein